MKNFRYHKCLDDIPFHDLTTFIGENDCGKTTIIDFLDLMIGYEKVNRSDFFQGNSAEGSEIIQEDEIIGKILFKINSREKTSLKKYLDKDEN
ncbi:MAG: ATP-binding protein [Clostridiaceae bacterium]|nr:ATP-binding protein [Clostridiaceae bacterium]MBW4859382.1 ATP-binding protein [Clostridiaceae bacterium]MBW4869390.1 ATP-binding protein [Clostridiaceae bacterium]